MSIEEYADKLGVDIDCFDGNFYVKLSDYEKLLEELAALKK